MISLLKTIGLKQLLVLGAENQQTGGLELYVPNLKKTGEEKNRIILAQFSSRQLFLVTADLLSPF